MEDESWIKIFRKIRDWGWYGVPGYLELWIELLLRATYKKRYKGLLALERGQCVVGRDELAKAVGSTAQSVRTKLNNLKLTNEITTQGTSKGTIITIVKYDEYQTSANQLTNNQPATNQQLTTNKKERKKERKNNTPGFDFEAVYQKYPKKVGKKKGIQSCTAQIKTQDDYARLVKAIDNYNFQIDRDKTEMRYVKHFSTFMNCWEDYVELEDPALALIKKYGQGDM